MASEPPDSSAKGISGLFDEMFAFIVVYFWKEYFGLSIVWGVKPLQVPSFSALEFADG